MYVRRFAMMLSLVALWAAPANASERATDFAKQGGIAFELSGSLDSETGYARAEGERKDTPEKFEAMGQFGLGGGGGVGGGAGSLLQFCGGGILICLFQVFLILYFVSFLPLDP